MIKLWFYGIVGAVALTILTTTYVSIKSAGRNAERAEQAEIVKRKLRDATIADDVNSRCLADPKCRLSDDGFRRD